MANAEWFDRIRARGICYVCRRPMADDDPRRAHTACLAAARHGRRVADIRRHPPEDRGGRSRRKDLEAL